VNHSDTNVTTITVETELGDFVVEGTDRFVTKVELPDGMLPRRIDVGRSAAVLTAAGQLREYFAGTRTVFDVPLLSMGTPFQESVWKTLETISYGTVESYGWVADRIGRPLSARPVGQALGKNPIAIFRPCHRVVAADGIGGFGGGVALKQALLALEGVSANEALQSLS
jgi:methylated-DNA-[protein]-cysteine S-methyltransferase